MAATFCACNHLSGFFVEQAQNVSFSQRLASHEPALPFRTALENLMDLHSFGQKIAANPLHAKLCWRDCTPEAGSGQLA